MDPKRDRTRVAGWLPFRKDWPTLQEKRTYSFLKKMSDLMFCLKAFFESCPAFLSPGRGFALYQGKAILGIWGGMASTMVKRGECYWVWWWCTPVIPATQKAEAGGSKCEASLYKLCVCWGLNLGPCACEADSRTSAPTVQFCKTLLKKKRKKPGMVVHKCGNPSTLGKLRQEDHC